MANTYYIDNRSDKEYSRMMGFMDSGKPNVGERFSRMDESMLKRIVRESVNKVLCETKFHDSKYCLIKDYSPEKIHYCDVRYRGTREECKNCLNTRVPEEDRKYYTIISYSKYLDDMYHAK